MSTDTQATSTLEQWLGGESGGLAASGLPWLDLTRRHAWERAQQAGIPSTRQEGWRYTSLKWLGEHRFSGGGPPQISLRRGDLEPVLIPGLDAHRAVLVNGRFAPELSSLVDLPTGVRAGSLRAVLEKDPDAVANRLNALAGDGIHLFSALNTAGIDDGFVLLVAPGVTVERPLEILHLSVGADAPRVTQPRHLALLNAGARATLVERYVSLGDPLYCTNALLELALEQDAALDHYRLQIESPKAFHLTGLYLRQAQDSRYRGLNLLLGAAWSRTDIVARFAGCGAETDLAGLYLAGDGQLVDVHLDVDHRVGHCRSRENFKGVLYGKGRAVFDGRIHVARNAQKTDAQLTNNNLLLSRAAEVDTKPQLEIFADDVQCSHGTTVGQIDSQALFYLRSRGIAEPVARRMLCLGFAGEIIDALHPEPLRDHVAEQVALRLEKAVLA